MATKAPAAPTPVTPEPTTEFTPLTGTVDPRVSQFVADFQRAGYAIVNIRRPGYEGPACRIANYNQVKGVSKVVITTTVDADGVLVVYPVLKQRED